MNACEPTCLEGTLMPLLTLYGIATGAGIAVWLLGGLTRMIWDRVVARIKKAEQ